MVKLNVQNRHLLLQFALQIWDSAAKVL